MVRFSLFGIPVEIQPWFWITLALIGGAGSANSSQALLFLLLFILAGFVSILVHELGHAMTGRHFGAPTKIVLQAFGGFAAFPANAFTRKQNFIVTAAGPLVQMILGGVFFLILLFVPLPTLATKVFVFWGYKISIYWALLNLIPVLPLDGGRLLESVLGPSRIRTTLQVSVITAVVAAVAVGLYFQSYIFPIFLGFMAFQNWQALQMYRR